MNILTFMEEWREWQENYSRSTCLSTANTLPEKTNISCFKKCASYSSNTIVYAIVVSPLVTLYSNYTSIPQRFSLWGDFICWDVFLGLYMLTWGFSGLPGSCLDIKSPTQTNGECENHKEMPFIQGTPQSSMLYLYTGSERSAFLFVPILPARWQNAG